MQHQVGGGSTGPEQFVSDQGVDLQFVREVKSGIRNPGFELLTLALVLADLHIPIHQL